MLWAGLMWLWFLTWVCSISAEVSQVHPGGWSCWPSRRRLKHNCKSCDHGPWHQPSGIWAHHGNSATPWWFPKKGPLSLYNCSCVKPLKAFPRLVNLRLRSRQIGVAVVCLVPLRRILWSGQKQLLNPCSCVEHLGSKSYQVLFIHWANIFWVYTRHYFYLLIIAN